MLHSVKKYLFLPTNANLKGSLGRDYLGKYASMSTPSKKQSRSAPFQATRSHHSQESAEDYTELIADLITEKGEARTCDIAKHLGISHVTALRTLQRLTHQGYVKAGGRQPISLTKKGAETASLSKRRHDILIRFFTALGVPRHISEIDVEGMEHHVSSVTLEAINRHLKKISGK